MKGACKIGYVVGLIFPGKSTLVSHLMTGGAGQHKIRDSHVHVRFTREREVNPGNSSVAHGMGKPYGLWTAKQSSQFWIQTGSLIVAMCSSTEYITITPGYFCDAMAVLIYPAS